jgi:hypothetical protein
MAAKLMHNQWYTTAHRCILLINILTLSIFWAPTNVTIMMYLNVVHHSLSVLLVLDTVVKVLAYGPTRYLGYIWRKLELFVSACCIMDLMLDWSVGWYRIYLTNTLFAESFIELRLLCVLRDVRVLLIIQEFKGTTPNK